MRRIVRVIAALFLFSNILLSFLPFAYSAEDGSVTGMASVLDDNDNISNPSSVSGHLTLTKTVQNITQNIPASISTVADPGDILEYRIQFTNTGVSDIRDMILHDSTPEFTSTQQAVTCDALLLPSSLSCKIATPHGNNRVGYKGDILWSLEGALSGGESGLVVYRVKINN
ncbi:MULTISPECIES: DUF11 domain-containing protein [unclassified Photobacterium]|uniref:DUF11 domain-containing protein n=1 Tax=unclassified Photobacterium TaxID=2628852 RepID=UPI001EDD7F3C|nr:MULTISPECIES: DUF11 domain-containing protein [unclassified Photobacterium]MCG3864807.1 DUF11 domain-containing protein [Photobacterium sp. Ph6]MCG3876197.1 DUF11 domain-containing protein [Photobacterium sp. Ph5]